MIGPDTVVISGASAGVGRAIARRFGRDSARVGLLARGGYRAQQTGGPIATDRPDNLYRPVPGEQGARGAFNDRAHGSSPQLWASEHRGGLVAAALLGAVGLWWRSRERPRSDRAR